MSARDDYSIFPCDWSVKMIDQALDEIDRLREVERKAKVLIQIVPEHWWTTPPNQATRDVMQGIEAFGIDPSEWRTALSAVDSV